MLNSIFEIDSIQFGVVLTSFVWIVFSVIAALWVYVDATKLGFELPSIWVLVTLIFPIFGLMLYLIVRYSHKSEAQIDRTYDKINKNQPQRKKKKGPIESY